MKICVYAISKNEEKFVKRFCDSIKDADYVLIADTGSTDDTVAIAKECGAIVYNIDVRPWRFDTARNISLGLVPQDMDICITLDLDEIMLSGWRKEIERVWIKNKTKILRHGKLENNKNLGHMYSNVFCRIGRMWRGICHEALFPDIQEIKSEYAYSDKILIKHLPDKTKSREYYYNLLKANVKEYPEELFALYNYAKEQYRYEKYEKSIKLANKFIVLYEKNPQISVLIYIYHLNLIYIIKGCSYLLLNNNIKCEKNYKLACDMNMHLRRPLIILAQFYFSQTQYKESYEYCKKALLLRTPIPKGNELKDEYWGCSPLIFASQVATKIGKHDEAQEYLLKAHTLQNLLKTGKNPFQ